MGISRDEICAQRIGLIEEMGSMEEELTVFGCAYLENGVTKYRVSNDATEIYQFLLDASADNLYPTPVQTLTIRRLMPKGEEDAVWYALKRQLAEQLHICYPADFFTFFSPLIEAPANNDAWPLLETVREAMEGRFEADMLQLYEGLLRHCRQKKLLDDAHQQIAWQWLEKNRNQMEDDVVVKERNQRTFHGFITLDTTNEIHCVCNLSLDKVVEKKIQFEQQGRCTGPVLQKTFWYQDAQVLPTLRNRFQEWLLTLAGDWLAPLLLQLNALPSAVTMPPWNDSLPKESQQALHWYTYLWNCQP